ncbi:MAG TPA: DNA polymerase III subunit gamma/tau [Clostridia bacterium]|nr:DNA polymerase III subunit gamma/tau [Clostridia bacterium]
MYRALYRKWRPQAFSDVSGQKHITDILQNAVVTGRHSHAYLFTGSRGTGKTSCAKIFAKAINCLDPVEGNPCNKCDICNGIDSGAVLDISEIDAASNNGVDNIRDLREETSFTPSVAKFRVYIIDEVHMLSAGAFNALLKTLEEPPEYVIFILATTEVHKLPATILSRCQRFDFRRIPVGDITNRLMFVAKSEKIELESEAALLIARVADGSLRDALSILDQCASLEGNVTVHRVSETVGLLGKDYLFELSDAINKNDTAKALKIINSLHNSSCDMERLIAELLNHFRNIMIAKTTEKPEALIVCTPDELEKYKDAAQTFTYAALLSISEMLCAGGDSLKYSAFQRAEAEVLIMKICTPSILEDNSALLRRIADLERDVKLLKGGVVVIGKKNVDTKKQEKEQITYKPKPLAEEENPEPLAKEEHEEEYEAGEEIELQDEQVTLNEDGEEEKDLYLLEDWTEVLSEILRSCPQIHSSLKGSTCTVSGNTAVIKVKSEAFDMLFSHQENEKAIKDAILKVTGKELKPTQFLETAGEESFEQETVDDLIERISSTNIEMNIRE